MNMLVGLELKQYQALFTLETAIGEEAIHVTANGSTILYIHNHFYSFFLSIMFWLRFTIHTSEALAAFLL